MNGRLRPVPGPRNGAALEVAGVTVPPPKNLVGSSFDFMAKRIVRQITFMQQGRIASSED